MPPSFLRLPREFLFRVRPLSLFTSLKKICAQFHACDRLLRSRAGNPSVLVSSSHSDSPPSVCPCVCVMWRGPRALMCLSDEVDGRPSRAVLQVLQARTAWRTASIHKPYICIKFRCTVVEYRTVYNARVQPYVPYCVQRILCRLCSRSLSSSLCMSLRSSWSHRLFRIVAPRERPRAPVRTSRSRSAKTCARSSIGRKSLEGCQKELNGA